MGNSLTHPVVILEYPFDGRKKITPGEIPRN
jgi:hypothetical protein